MINASNDPSSNIVINDLASLKKHGPALDAELKQVFARYGMSWADRTASVGNTEVEYTIKVGIGTKENAEADAKRRYDNLAGILGLPEGKFGKVFSQMGERYRITGVNPKPKNWLSITRLSDNSPRNTSERFLIGARWED